MDEESNFLTIAEYFITIKQDIKKTSLKNFINEAIEGFSIENNIIKKNNPHTIPANTDSPLLFYELIKIKHFHKRTKNTFFIMKLNFAHEDIENFEELVTQPLYDDIKKFQYLFLLKIREIQYFENIQITFNQLSSYICHKAYPIIYQIENLMRSLIYKTMTIFANKNWIDSEIPDDVKKSFMNSMKKQKNIFGTNFSDLSKILFDITGKDNLYQLSNLVYQLQECKKDDIEKIKKITPKTNWQKYFAKLKLENDIEAIKNHIYKNSRNIKTDQDVIRSVFDDLYEFRNRIAHNDIEIDEEFYDELKQKAKYATQWIENAIKYIEEKSIQMSINNIQLNKNEEELIICINKLILEVKHLYNLDDQEDKALDSFLFSQFYYKEDEDENYKCDEKCIRDIKHYMYLKKQILKEEKNIDNDDKNLHIDHIRHIIENLSNCPKISEDKNKTDEIENYSINPPIVE